MLKSFFTYLLLLALACGVAGAYGAIHDQLSFTISHEYFTRFKYHQFGLVDSPLAHRIKASLIGFLATWWMGIPIGLTVGSFGFLHRPAKAMLVRTMKAYLVVAAVTLAVGLGGLIYGWFAASSHPADYVHWFIPADLQYPKQFLAVGHLHNFGYAGGVVGIIAGVIAQFRLRCRSAN